MQSSGSFVPSSPALSDESNSTDSQDSSNVVARSRWRILAQALLKTGPLATIPSSVRRFQSYGLVTALPLENICETDVVWYEYSAAIGQEIFSVLVSHPKRSFTASDLMGFNNTGNICVWPSEEVLAYYGLCNRYLFANKSVLEVGGGMSCLAGLMIGKYSAAAKVHLTDGNVASMENVSKILRKNGFGESSHVTSSVLQWGKQSKSRYSESVSAKSYIEEEKSVYDIILCADCLFFDEVRPDLVQTICDFMADDGMALLTAPRRAETLEKFCDEASHAGLSYELQEIYNEQVWDRHIQLKTNYCQTYEEDIHYPLLLHLFKTMKG